MSRFIQPQPQKQPKQEKPREMTRPGSYTSEDLMGSKKISTKGGYK